MPNITPAELEELLRKQAARDGRKLPATDRPPVKRAVASSPAPVATLKLWRPGEPIELFIAGELANTMNKRWGWRRDMKYKQRWREAVYGYLAAVGYRMGMVDPKSPKRITMVAHVFNRFDSKTDGLRASLKSIPDAMKKAEVIEDDRDSSAHEFVYGQVVDRKRRGVEVTVEFL